jgi:hypothetical protein
MGHVVPDRLFWAQPDDTPESGNSDTTASSFFTSTLEFPPNDTKH